MCKAQELARVRVLHASAPIFVHQGSTRAFCARECMRDFSCMIQWLRHICDIEAVHLSAERPLSFFRVTAKTSWSNFSNRRVVHRAAKAVDILSPAKACKLVAEVVPVGLLPHFSAPRHADMALRTTISSVSVSGWVSCRSLHR